MFIAHECLQNWSREYHSTVHFACTAPIQSCGLLYNINFSMWCYVWTTLPLLTHHTTTMQYSTTEHAKPAGVKAPPASSDYSQLGGGTNSVYSRLNLAGSVQPTGQVEINDTVSMCL